MPEYVRPTYSAVDAARGLLTQFLDELGEFAPAVLDGMRQPLEEGVIRLAVAGLRRDLKLAPQRLQRLPHLHEPERLTRAERVHRDAEHERLLLRQPQHLLELIDDHAAEVRRGLGAAQHRGRVVDLDRIRHRHDAALARLHPERLIVGRPVHQEGVAVLLQQIGRHGRLRNPRPHPAVGTPPAALGHRLRRVRDHRGFRRLIHVGLALGVGVAVADRRCRVIDGELDQRARDELRPGPGQSQCPAAARTRR